MENIVNTPEQLGRALRQHRKSGNRSQAELGDSVGLLRKTVAGLELQPARSQIGTLMKLVSALDLELVLRPKRTDESGEW